MQKKHSPEVIAEIERLLHNNTDNEVAQVVTTNTIFSVKRCCKRLNNNIDIGVTMSQCSEGIEPAISVYPPSIATCFANGWKKLWGSFFRLCAIVILFFLIYALISGSPKVLPLLGYFFLYPLLSYGMSFAFLKAARGDSVKVTDLFYPFKHYWKVVVAHILTCLIVIAGMLLLIIPGIIFFCKLFFVPYLVVDRKMKPIEAIKASWNMTENSVLKIILMGVVAFFIHIIGLLCLIVGFIPALIWSGIAFASLYHAKTSQQAI